MENKLAPAKRKTGKKIAIAFAVILLLLVVAAGGAFLYYKYSLTAMNPNCAEDNSCEVVTFSVIENSGGAKIAADLQEKGLIRNALTFRIYLKIEADQLNLKPGSYEFNKGMDVAEIIRSLNEGVAAKTFRITFLPGATLEDARQRLRNFGYSDEEINVAFTKKYDHPLLKYRPADSNIEGYIYGDTYEFYVGTKVEDIMIRTFDEMYEAVQIEGLEAKLAAQGLNLHQGIILASIVQREAPADYSARQQVAQVFLLRLKKGIPLGSDVVIAYRADQLNPNRNKNDMSYLNTIDCPWNSRRCAGLPPGSVSNPGLSSLRAVANPAPGEYLYFLTGDDGTMHYSYTQSEHDAKARQYCKVLCQIL